MEILYLISGLMRLPLYLYLRTASLSRRYLPYTTCRLGRVGMGGAHQQQTRAHSIYRRGLVQGWAHGAVGPTLLDTPHTKVYRLAFDVRVYLDKAPDAFIRRAQRSLNFEIGSEYNRALLG